MWYNKYIDIPYLDGGRDLAGLDCWGLVRLVYREQYSIELPSFVDEYTTARDHERLQEIFAREREGWTPLSTPDVGSVLLFRILGAEVHVGVYIGDRKFLHIRQGVNSVVESLDSPVWSKRFVGAFAYQPSAGTTLVARPRVLKTETVVTPVFEGTNLQFLADWLHTTENVDKKILERSVFLLNGKPVHSDQWSSTVVQCGDSLEFRALAGDSDMFRLFAVLAIALIAPQVAGFVKANAVLAGTTLTTAKVLAGAAYAATIIAGTAIINAIAPIPEQPGAPTASQAQLFINGTSNQATPWNGIPIVLGKMRMTPPLGALPYVRFTSDENILNGSGNGDSGGVATNTTFVDMLLIWGYGPVVIDAATLRIGQVGFYNLDAQGNIVGQNYDEARIITLDRQTTVTSTQQAEFDAIYGQDVQQILPNNATLEYEGLPPVAGGAWTPQPRPTTDTGWREFAFTQPSEKVSVDISFPQGLRATVVKGNGAGSEKAAPVGVELQYKIGNGSWTAWPGGTAGAGHYTVGGKVQKETTSETYTELQYDSEGVYTEVTVTRTYPQNQIQTGTMIADGFTWTVTLNRIVNGTPRWGADDLLSIRVRRTTGSDVEPSDSYRYTHAALVQAVTSTRNANPAVDPPGVTLAKSAVTIKATDEINGQVDGINAVVQTVCPDWDQATQTWITRATSNPASLYRFVLQHPSNPLPVPDSQIDLVQLQYWHNYCNTSRSLVYNGSTYNYTLQYNNIVVGQTRSVFDVLREISSAGRASPAMRDGKWSVVIDEPKTTVVQHFTPHNSWGFEATKLLPRLPDALKVQFYDSESDYTQKEIIVSYTNSSATTAQLLETISLPGITSTAEAVSHAKWHLAQIKLRPEVYTLNVDIEYLVCNRGDRVKVTHWVPGWGLGSGRVKDVYGSRTLELDEQVVVDTTKTNVIRVRNSSTGASAQYEVQQTFVLQSYSVNNGTITVTTNTAHPLLPGDVCTISNSLGILNGTVGTITAVGYVGGEPRSFSYTTNLQLANQGTTNITGTVSLVTQYYKRVVTSTAFSSIAASDLFVFGELNKESQDLIVTKIEPTTNKSARITMVDYGVTDTYNIFTDYSTTAITNSTIFESQISVVPELFNQVGDKKPVLDPSTFISDERVMRVKGPGVFEYRMKIPFTNPQGLGNDVTQVVAEIYPANNFDVSGMRKVAVPVTSGSIEFGDLVELDAYRFRLRYETKLGKTGPWTDWYVYGVLGKTNPPAQVTLYNGGYEELQSQLKLVWNDNAEVDIQHYEVRESDSGWGDDNYLFRGLTTELPVVLTQPGSSKTWYIKAVDYAGNYSVVATPITYNYVAIPNITEIRYSYSSSSLTEATVTLSWSAPATSVFGIKEYILTYSSTSVTVNSTSVTVPANWLGNRDFTVRVVDLLGNQSSGFTEAVPKFAPNPIAQADYRIQVIDNNVLLYWKNPARTSLPIAHVLIKRGGVSSTWETAEVVGTKSGEFTSFSELASGTYTYYLAVVDTDGRESTPIARTEQVSQPPDFIFNGKHSSTFANQNGNVVVTYNNSYTYNGELLLPVNTAETFEQHFVNSTWTTPQDQIDAGYPYYVQPGLSTGSYTEEVDFQTVIGSSQLTLTVVGGDLVGNCQVVTRMYTKAAPGDSYVETTGFATNFRYVKIEVVATQTVAGSIYRLTEISLVLSSKQITESNKVLVNGSQVVNFTKEFVDVASVVLTPNATTPLTAVYDLKDTTLYATYAVVGNVCTVTTLTPHGYVTTQLIKHYFTSGGGISGRYEILSVPSTTSYTFSMVTSNTSGDVTVYPNSLVAYLYVPQNGNPATAEVSYTIRGY